MRVTATEIKAFSYSALSKQSRKAGQIQLLPPPWLYPRPRRHMDMGILALQAFPVQRRCIDRVPPA